MASDPDGGNGLTAQEGPGSRAQDPMPDGHAHPVTEPPAAASPESADRRAAQDRQPPSGDHHATAPVAQNAGFFGFLERVLSTTKLTRNAVILMLASGIAICAIGWFFSGVTAHAGDGFTAVISKSGITIAFTSAGTVAVTLAVAVRFARRRSRMRRGKRPDPTPGDEAKTDQPVKMS